MPTLLAQADLTDGVPGSSLADYPCQVGGPFQFAPPSNIATGVNFWTPSQDGEFYKQGGDGGYSNTSGDGHPTVDAGQSVVRVEVLYKRIVGAGDYDGGVTFNEGNGLGWLFRAEGPHLKLYEKTGTGPGDYEERASELDVFAGLGNYEAMLAALADGDRITCWLNGVTVHFPGASNAGRLTFPNRANKDQTRHGFRSYWGSGDNRFNSFKVWGF